jgi:hypothetical protein
VSRLLLLLLKWLAVAFPPMVALGLGQLYPPLNILLSVTGGFISMTAFFVFQTKAAEREEDILCCLHDPLMVKAVNDGLDPLWQCYADERDRELVGKVAVGIILTKLAASRFDRP